jgi:small subunit ribosomal protein S20
MANIKSAIKRIGVNAKKKEQNKSERTALTNEIKKFRGAISNNELALAEELLKTVSASLDKAAQSNVIHKNKADRQKSKLAKLLFVAKPKVAPKAPKAAKKVAEKVAEPTTEPTTIA